MSIGANEPPPGGREIVRANLKADGSALGVCTATYDPIGNRITIQEFDGTLVTHAYDDLYRLILDQRNGSYAFNRTYTYDEVGNRLTKSDCGALCTYGYDQADQLLRVGPWGSYVYPTNWTSDENGNLITENYAGNITNNTFDTENRLTKLVQPSGYTEENQYSADGLRRVRLAGTSTITYLWDDHVLLRDNAIYTTLPGVTGGLLAAKAGADHRFYVPDMQGHVRQVTDIDGDVVAEYQYDAWGLIQLTAASAMAFADWGYAWDGKPGRYYVQQRHLRADLGRWMSVDPVETEPPYAYVGNRPTWGVDPSGEQFGAPRTDGGPRADLYNYVMGRAWSGMESEVRTAGRVLTNPRTYEEPIEWFFRWVEPPWRAAFEAPENLTDAALRKAGLSPLTQSEWRAFGHAFPNLWKTAAPPPGNPTSLISYTGGFVFGAAEAATWSVVGLPIDALKLVHYFAGLPQDVWGDIRKLLWDSLGSLRHALASQIYWRPYDRGKLAGSLLVTAVGVVLAGKSVAGRLSALIRRIAKAMGLGASEMTVEAQVSCADRLISRLETEGAARAAACEAGEHNAEAWLRALEAAHNAHFVKLHGPEVSLPELIARATRGFVLGAGYRKPVDASRFYSYKIMQRVIDEAYRLRTPGQEYVRVPMSEYVGEGYRKGDGHTLWRTREAEVRFAASGPDADKPYTAYPALKSGSPAP